MFKVKGPIARIETIASGNGIREVARLNSTYGGRNWKKKKGIAIIELEDGHCMNAELHWYEAHGIGKVELKIKELLG